MKIVICEDDIETGELIRSYIIHFYKMKSLGNPDIYMFSSAEEMLVKRDMYDIAFLDVQLPGVSGLAAGDVLKKWNESIIIFVVTGYSDTYIDDSFDLGVFRYLTKPLDEMRLHRNLQMAIKRYKSICGKLVIETSNGMISFDIRKIIMIRSENRKTALYTMDGKYMTSMKFKEWTGLLPETAFMIVNKGVIIGLQHIERERNGEITLTDLDELKDVYVSKKYLSEFKKRWLLFQEIK